MERFSVWPESSRSALSGGKLEHPWKVLVRDLYYHADDCLAIWLPPSSNAALLIAKATTQMKEVAFSQPIRWYQTLCCYQVSRTSLLNVQRLRELVLVDRDIWQQCQNWRLIFLDIQHLTFSSVLKSYTYPVLPQLPKRKTCLSKGRTNWYWSIDIETSHNCCCDESLELLNE